MDAAREAVGPGRLLWPTEGEVDPCRVQDPELGVDPSADPALDTACGRPEALLGPTAIWEIGADTSGLRGRWRLWGTSDLLTWFSLDVDRPRKDTAVVLDVGTRIAPAFTPDDPDAVLAAIRAHL